MTNPDNVGGLPELPELPEPRLRPYKQLDTVYYNAGQMKEYARAYGELCRAAPTGMVLVPREIVANYRESTHIPRHRRICDAALAAPAGGEYEHRWNEDGERCVKCGDKDWMGGPCSKPDAAPAGSGEVEGAIRWLDGAIAGAKIDGKNGYMSPCVTVWSAELERIRTLLRKLQQGAVEELELLVIDLLACEGCDDPHNDSALGNLHAYIRRRGLGDALHEATHYPEDYQRKAAQTETIGGILDDDPTG